MADGGAYHGGDGRRQGGFKRRREEDDNYGRQRSGLSVVATLIRLCNQQGGEDQVPPEEQLDNLVRAIARDLHTKKEQLTQLILDCAVELSHKTPVYAVLIGLLNAEEGAFIEQLLASARAQLEEALAACDRNKARLLLRLFAALVPCHVLHGSAVLQTLHAMVEAALQIASKGGSSTDEQRVWQPYADFLVYAALMALPWGGTDLAESAPQDLEKLLGDVGKYVALRPAAHTPALRPFFEGDDPASMSDSGAASFLGQVWEAVQELAATKKWRVESVPSYISQQNEAQLASGNPHDLQPPAIPHHPPCLAPDHGLPAIQAAAVVLAAFPPRGVIRLLPAETTWGERPKMERLVAEEYMLDTIHYFEGDRVECARTLALGLPLSGKIEPILTETIFSQMLRVPTPHLKPIAYATIMADLCRLLPAVPRSMSACMREFFQRIGALDPQLRAQLAEWLAYHLSNFDFMWPWAKWAYVLQEPAHHPQRRFVVEVFSRLIRLSYYSNILSKVPDGYKEIFPPEPKPRPLEPQQDSNGSGPPPAELEYAAKLVQLVKAKKSSAEIRDWADEQALSQRLGGVPGVLRALLRGLLVAGSKSFTHMLIALERYEALLTPLLAEAGEEGQIALVAAAADVWQDAPQRAAQAIETLMAQRLVDGASIVRWAFASPGLLSLDNQVANSLAWEVVYNAVNKTLARTQDAREEFEAAGGGKQPQNGSALPAEAEDAAMAETQGDGVLGVTDDREESKAAALAEREKELHEATDTQRSLFLLCFQLFSEVLASNQPAAAADELDSEAAAAGEWHKYTVACLQAFTRRYHAAVAPLSQVLESGVFAAGAAGAHVRQAFLQSLHI